MSKQYDVIIIGAGPAGLTAGLYAGRARLTTLMIEQQKEGGQIAQTAEIDNYPGSIEAESGQSLVERMMDQAFKFGVEKVYDTVTEVQLEGMVKKVLCAGGEYEAKSVIVAGGASPMKIGCPGEEEFTGRGVSYCATCDAPFFRGLQVYVVGGGDAAVEEAIYLTKFAKKVTVIHRRDALRAAKSIQEKAMANDKIEFLWDSVVKEIKGDGLLDTILVENVKTGAVTEFQADPEDGAIGVFVFIGYRPKTELYEGKLTMEKSYLVADEDMHTNIPGVFAAGDIRVKSLRQVVTAAADGAIAAVQAEKYIEDMQIV